MLVLLKEYEDEEWPQSKSENSNKVAYCLRRLHRCTKAVGSNREAPQCVSQLQIRDNQVSVE